MSIEGLIDSLREGALVPGSRLAALATVTLHQKGWQVRHFGNTYGRLDAAAHILRVQQDRHLACTPDNADSWHFADVYTDHRSRDSRYPLHLLDMTSCEAEARAELPSLVSRSLVSGAPITLIPRRDLSETIRTGGA